MDDIGNDRIIAIQLRVDDTHNFYIVGTYLLSANQPIVFYKESVDELDVVINELSNRGANIILGILTVILAILVVPEVLMPLMTEVNISSL